MCEEITLVAVFMTISIVSLIMVLGVISLLDFVYKAICGTEDND